MIAKVNNIAKNPLTAASEEENHQVAIELAKEEGPKRKKQAKHGPKKKKKEEKPFETAILEQTIIKIGGLLAVGFGEAGSEIIANNMRSGGDIDPMIAGKKMLGIFGFCDIRNFTDATEVLQEEVMIFVNEIAETVHSIASHFSGSANKNIGDAFLLVWKFDREDYGMNDDGSFILHDTHAGAQLTDMALISFVITIGRINTAYKLQKYSKLPGLTQRLPNYSVKLGFGLHFGWAIEGAIGSEFKIDASYLSPNVNLASQLEGETKYYGVLLLVSNSLYENLSGEAQKYLRAIDRVSLKGSNKPVELYTIDMDISNLDPESSTDYLRVKNLPRREKKRIKVRARIRRDNLKNAVRRNEFYVHTLMETEIDIIKMRATISEQFTAKHQEAYENYVNGEWAAAKQLFEEALAIKQSSDGPTNAIMKFMHDYNYTSPLEWKGFRSNE